jgi:hypothetical protein
MGIISLGGNSSSYSVRRLGSAIGLVTLIFLDLLALDDTTAGAWIPEMVFLVASVPALVALGYFTFRRSASRRELRDVDPADRFVR